MACNYMALSQIPRKVNFIYHTQYYAGQKFWPSISAILFPNSYNIDRYIENWLF
jgi:hypothetical protein